MKEDNLREDLGRLQRSMDRIYEYLQNMPMLESVSGDVACLEEMMWKWRNEDDTKL